MKYRTGKQLRVGFADLVAYYALTSDHTAQIFDYLSGFSAYEAPALCAALTMVEEAIENTSFRGEP